MLKNIEANTKMADLGARQQALEEGLALVTGERDVQRAAAEQKARGPRRRLTSCNAFGRRLRRRLEKPRRRAPSCGALEQRLSTIRPSFSTRR